MIYSAVAIVASVVGATDLVCSEDIVRTAETQGFVSYIYNSVLNEETTIGPQSCLAAFIDENALDNPHSITNGSCRDTYQMLVDSWAAHINVSPTELNCPPGDILPGSIPMNSESYRFCLLSGLHFAASSTRDFYGVTGFFPFRMCTGEQVRHGHFDLLMHEVWYTMNTWIAFPEYAACNVCYTSVISRLLNISPPDNIKEACTATGGPTELCLSTTMMIKAREAFLKCAGYDVLATEGMCTADGVAAVEALYPSPYYTFSQCAYNPKTAICTTTSVYLDEIEYVTGSVDCLACYAELQSDLIALAATENVCGGSVFSDACIAFNTDALAAFKLCSGFSLITISAAPLVATTVGPFDDTTAMTLAPTTGTTVASTTTKGSVFYWFSMIGMILL